MKLGFTTTSFRQIRDREKIVNVARDCGADIIEWGGDIHVKSVADAMHAIVDSFRAETAVDADGAELLAQWFQNLARQVGEGCNLQAVGGVVHVVSLGPCRARHLVIAEVRGQLKVLSFHKFIRFK